LDHLRGVLQPLETGQLALGFGGFALATQGVRQPAERARIGRRSLHHVSEGALRLGLTAKLRQAERVAIARIEVFWSLTETCLEVAGRLCNGAIAGVPLQEHESLIVE